MSLADFKSALPWLASLGFLPKIVVSAVIVLLAIFLLLQMWLPIPQPARPEDNEIAHRIAHIQGSLSRDPMTVGDAYEALYAVLGGGGAFRATSQEYREISLPALALRANRTEVEVNRLRALEQSLRKVPGGSSTNTVDGKLAQEIRANFASLASS